MTRNNLRGLDARFPLGVLCSVSGVSGSGKSTLVSQALVELVGAALGQGTATDEVDESPLAPAAAPTGGRIAGGLEGIGRLVTVDQKAIGRTPRSNLATYTGLFDHVRKLFAATPAAEAGIRRARRFSFNLGKGRCANCEGEGQVMVELLFLPSVISSYVCHGTRYNAETLKVEYRGKDIAQVLQLTVDDALAFFADEAALERPLSVLADVGLGYLRLGQSATELSGGEAQRSSWPHRAAAPPAGRHPVHPRRTHDGLPGGASTASWPGSIPWWLAATPSSPSNTTCACWPPATGSSTSAPARATTAASSWPAARRRRCSKTRASRLAPFLKKPCDKPVRSHVC